MNPPEYISSEELQRHNASVFAGVTEEKKEKTTETEKLKKTLAKYIAQHDTTTKVRAIADHKSANRNSRILKYGTEYQLDLSADIVEILEKIKSELR